MSLSSNTLTNSQAEFNTTCWELVRLAGDSGACDVDSSKAQEELFLRYWPAVYAYLRRTGADRTSAEDLTQGFFTEVVLWRDLFARARPERGRLRSFILAAVKNYVVDQHRRLAARPDARLLSSHVNMDILDREIAADASPEHAFDRQWAKACLDVAIARCRDYCLRTGKATHWALYERRELLPACFGTTSPPLEALARELGCRSAAHAAALVQTVRLRLEAILAEVAEGTTTNATDSIAR